MSDNEHKNDNPNKQDSSTESDKEDLSPGESKDENQKSDKQQNKTSEELKREINNLEKLLNAKESDLPENIGESLAKKRNGASCNSNYNTIEVAVESKREAKAFTKNDINEVNKATVALDARLQALLQATTLCRSRTSYQGKLNTRKLYKAKYVQRGNHHYIYFQANGFLRAQVRMMVDAVMSCAMGKMTLTALTEQLNTSTKHTTNLAPPHGLYLARILY